MSEAGDDKGNETAGRPEAVSDDAAAGTQTFGSCCDELRQALAAPGFEPFVVVGQDGILYMSVGELIVDDDQHSYVDHPIFFCPFCGTELQSRDEIMARLNADDGATTGADGEAGDDVEK